MVEEEIKANASQREVISDENELENLFKPEITEGRISDKLDMPTPGDEGVVVRVLYTKGVDGKLGIIDRVYNSKFKNGVAEFMTVEKVDSPGIQLKMGVGESIKNSFRRMMNDEKWKVKDLPNKVVHITASFWKKAPISARNPRVKCKVCKGAGCDDCDGSGLQSPVVFNAIARHDIMSNHKSTRQAYKLGGCSFL